MLVVLKPPVVVLNVLLLGVELLLGCVTPVVLLEGPSVVLVPVVVDLKFVIVFCGVDDVE